MKRRRFIKDIAHYTATCAAATIPYFLSYLLAPSVKATPQTRLPLPGALADTDELTKRVSVVARAGKCVHRNVYSFVTTKGDIGLIRPTLTRKTRAVYCVANAWKPAPLMH